MTGPIAPALSQLPSVELMHTGTWSASTGIHTFTTGDFASAVAALDCPAVRRPVLKLGHTDPRFDGEPAVGWIANMAVAEDGHTMVGDYVGMPGWLGPVLASAFPDRSIEGQWEYQCAIGHTHPFVITAVALLGVEHPAIGTLESLQDVATLYGVAASSGGHGQRVTVHLKGSAMPNPKPPAVALGVSTEDVRRAYYEDAPWSVWIEEMQLDPLQLIVIDDDTGTRSRVPITVTGDGADGVTFEAAIPVVVRYEDVTPAAPADPAAAPDIAASAPTAIRYANRAESRPGQSASASTPTAVHAGGNDPKGGSTVALTLTDEQEAAFREALGVDADADVDAMVTAAEELATTPEEPAPAAAAASRGVAASGVVQVDAAQFAALQAQAARGEQAATRQEDDDRARILDDAVRAGKFQPARRAHWETLLKADPEGTRETIAGLAANLVPVGASIGTAKDAPESDFTADDIGALEASLGLPKGALNA